MQPTASTEEQFFYYLFLARIRHRHKQGLVKTSERSILVRAREPEIQRKHLDFVQRTAIQEWSEETKPEKGTNVLDVVVANIMPLGLMTESHFNEQDAIPREGSA